MSLASSLLWKLPLNRRGQLPKIFPPRNHSKILLTRTYRVRRLQVFIPWSIPKGTPTRSNPRKALSNPRKALPNPRKPRRVGTLAQAQRAKKAKEPIQVATTMLMLLKRGVQKRWTAEPSNLRKPRRVKLRAPSRVTPRQALKGLKRIRLKRIKILQQRANRVSPTAPCVVTPSPSSPRPSTTGRPSSWAAIFVNPTATAHPDAADGSG
mmetsp:Transcript_13802/g.32843  ORF Transcript_13802/g.32843 Transcript_13802/m.32843 type:complete len:209 (-) Transcript_13802:183-809(-)